MAHTRLAPADRDMTVLREKNVLVTGGASGFGAAVVTSFAAAGARVVIADLNEELGLSLERQLIDAGKCVKFIKVDVTSVGSQIAMFKHGLAFLEGGVFDSVVMSAGVGGSYVDIDPVGPENLDSVSMQPYDRWALTINTNLTGSLLTCQLAVKYAMGCDKVEKSLGFRSVTFVGSYGGYRALPTVADYTASKFGVRGMFKTFRQALPTIGLRCNLIAPAFVRTPLVAAHASLYESKGVVFAEIDEVVNAVTQVVTDTSRHGRSLAITSEGVADLQDDVDGLDGNDVLAGLVERHAVSKHSPGKGPAFLCVD